jgi:serine/threonine-protein kinase RsbW
MNPARDTGSMRAEPRRVEVTLKSRIEHVDLGEELARQVADVAGFDEDEQYKISMSVRECLINALKHGNQGDQDKNILLSLFLQPDRLVVQVGDQGTGFNLGAIPDPLADENLLKGSGRGLFLVRCFMDNLRVECSDQGGALVILSKRYSSNNNKSAESNPKKEKRQ